MKKTAIVCVLAAIGLVSACAGPRWVGHDGRESSAALSAKQQCEYEAELNTQGPLGGGASGMAGAMEQGMRKGKLVRMCMEMRGFHPVY